MVKTHEPVLLQEVLGEIFTIVEGEPSTALLKTNSQKSIIDATLGLGGHSVEFVKRGAFVLGLDLDKDAIKIAGERLERACPTLNGKVQSCFNLIHGSFKDIDQIAREEGIESVDAVLVDLGVNTPQLTSAERGFSFGHADARLDMRFDPSTQNVKASDLLNGLRQDQLKEVFSQTCNYQMSMSLSKAVLQRRKEKPFNKVGDFLEIVEKKKAKDKIHPATKAFLALRMAVNSELDSLKEALPKFFTLLKKGGSLIVISFHSGEDRIVKRFFGELEKLDQAKVSKNPIVPGPGEIARNPRSRSAKMRIAKKL